MKKVLFSIRIYGIDSALLLLRGAVSIMMLRHGWTKIANFSENLNQFPDPFASRELPFIYLVNFVLGYSLLRAIVNGWDDFQLLPHPLFRKN